MALREYVKEYDGVVRVRALGKYGNSGRVNFKDNTFMWVFIKAHAGGKKFVFEGAKDTIWFSIEKTEKERLVAKKTGYLCRTLVDRIKEKQGVTQMAAMKFVDGEYVRGYVVYLVPAHSTTGATTNAVANHTESQIIIFDSKDGVTSWTTDLARDILALCDFKWDDTLVHVNEIGGDNA